MPVTGEAREAHSAEQTEVHNFQASQTTERSFGHALFEEHFLCWGDHRMMMAVE